MGSASLYRKYRPQKLSEIIGQEHITKTLANQVESGNISHAYLFSGSRGIGKTSAARIFAKAINCPNHKKGEPCETCDICESLSRENLDIIEIDAASNNRVDEIRELREKVKFSPIKASKKVYIIDEVHMLSDSAFNALLKTLEEPPLHVIFILATTEPQKLPATILSRCLRFDFKLLTNEDIVKLLKQVLTNAKIKFDEESLKLIASSAEGSARDSLSIADMCASFCDNNLTYDKVLEVLGAIDKNVLITLNKGIIEGNIQLVFETYNKLISSGKGINNLIKELIGFYRDLIIIKSCDDPNKMLGQPKEIFNETVKLSNQIDNERVIEIMDLFAKLELDIKNTLSAKVLFEATLIKASIEGQKKTDNLTEIKVNKVKEKETAVKTSENEDKNFMKIFGGLLTELKQQGFMALYGMLSDVKIGKIEKNYLIGFTSNEGIISMTDKESNKKLIENIITSVLKENLKFKLELEEAIENNFKDANKILNGKLIIK